MFVCILPQGKYKSVFTFLICHLKKLLLWQNFFAVLRISLCSEFVINFLVGEFCPKLFCIANSRTEIFYKMKVHTFVCVNGNRVQSMLLCLCHENYFDLKAFANRILSQIPYLPKAELSKRAHLSFISSSQSSFFWNFETWEDWVLLERICHHT